LVRPKSCETKKLQVEFHNKLLTVACVENAFVWLWNIH